MLRRYQKLAEFLHQVDDDDVQALLPSYDEWEEIEKLCAKMKGLDSVTNTLQDSQTTMADARILFDAVNNHNESAKFRLSHDARIVENATFESAITKVQLQQEECLSVREKRAIAHLKSDQGIISEDVQEDRRLSFAQVALKKRRLNEDPKSVYMDL